MTKPLFDNFDEVSTKQWKQKIQFDLKGADYNEALIFKSLEGIDIKPFYNQDDLTNIDITQLHPTSWKNAHRVLVNEAGEGNKKALDLIKKGVESIYFVITNQNISLPTLFQNLPKEIPLFVQTEFLSSAYNKELNTIAKNDDLKIWVLTDIIGNLSQTGNWFKNLKEDHTNLELLTNESSHLKSIISIDCGLYQNAGATMVQQLAYGIAHINEYLNHFDTKEVNPFKNSPVVFKVAIGGNYFFEIAKLRALRLLWNTLAAEYGIQKNCHILAFPSYRNKTILDYNVNMLRTTTECMSAILGGADTIYNVPYDAIYNLDNDFGTRISLNQLLILKNESYFGLVSNPASGAYYIESLTDQLAEKALSLFKNIEEGGGFLHQLKSGIIQKKIKESADKEQELFDAEKIVLTGSNKYQNTEEVIPRFEKPPFPEKKARKTILAPIITRRLPQQIEQKTVKNLT
ncbi:methylmalonyl-CoA mutase subunit beta [Aquimarina sp. 2201CG5-10]|uniref:methylmalonyl-CoA mutase subunit beta n=1 Tax=Aquimarina callyspongiae TaxID=3098150 RepID=UPI002AB3A77C|nr:methylmalonyl-CoA mutase subunit beta [Aquimarina sp. 2201CG5-10]MDY8137634.1 methylmalonyl-CoA mutase subunit beta [Aquimarina sp. 2201CG5-10]